MSATDVPAVRQHDHAAAHGELPAWIELDVEGYRPEALAESRRILAAGNPWVHMQLNTVTLDAYAGHSPAVAPAVPPLRRQLARALRVPSGAPPSPGVGERASPDIRAGRHPRRAQP